MSLYGNLAENLRYIAPKFYKKRYFKNLSGLSAQNIFSRKAEPELLWLMDFLPKDAVVMDIGANVGAYLFILEKIISQENIYAFEPNQKLYKRLKKIFPAVNISPVALSDQNTTADFKIPIIGGKEIASRGTLKTSMEERGESSKKIQKVSVMRLDDWVLAQNISRIDFIKIDVEGNEISTVRGAENTIKKFLPTLMVEMEQRHHQEPLWDFIGEVKNFGYEAKYLDRQSFTLKNLTQEFLEKQDAANLKNYKNYINNIIFIPKK